MAPQLFRNQTCGATSCEIGWIQQFIVLGGVLYWDEECNLSFERLKYPLSCPIFWGTPTLQVAANHWRLGCLGQWWLSCRVQKHAGRIAYMHHIKLIYVEASHMDALTFPGKWAHTFLTRLRSWRERRRRRRTRRARVRDEERRSKRKKEVAPHQWTSLNKGSSLKWDAT